MSGYEVKFSNSKKGKGLFATKNFEKGDIILVEEPLVSCQFAWNAAYKYLACDFCMRPLETPEQNVRRLAGKPDIVLPYPDCINSKLDEIVGCDQCNILYCSASCKEKAYNVYHRLLCHDISDTNHPLVQLLEAWKQMHYPPETANIMLLVRLLAYIRQHPDPSQAASIVKQFCHRTVNEDQQLVHKLLGLKFIGQLNTLREMTANAIGSDTVQEFLTPDGFSQLMALVGTNGQGVGTSALANWVQAAEQLVLSDDEREQLSHLIDKLYENVERESGTFLNTEGSALYVVQSACNHSCMPNAEVEFPYSNHTLVLKATRDIPQGEEMLISYLDECTQSRSRHSRQKELARNYLFVCECVLCQQQASQPDCTSEESMSDSDEQDMED